MADDLRRVRHFRVVNTETGGIAYSSSEDEQGHAARLNAEGWLDHLGNGYRIEEWEQITPMVASTWRRIDPAESDEPRTSPSAARPSVNTTEGDAS